VNSLSVSRRRHGALCAFAAAFASLALLAPQAGSGSAPVECREVTCSTSFMVGERSVKWSSPQVFYPNNERVFADLTTDRGPMTLVQSYGAEGCKHRFFGSGVSALVAACGSNSSLRVRAFRVKRGARPLSIVYSASAAMDGAPESPTTGASLSSPQLKPISKPLGE
jgi:hypothetical protein